MSLKSLAQAELAKFIAADTTPVVTIVANGISGSAVSDSSRNESSLDAFGDKGAQVCTYYGNADTFAGLKDGQLVKVNGVDANLLRHDVDPAGAVVTMVCQFQRPVSGAPDTI